jgi:hypothetical protein
MEDGVYAFEDRGEVGGAEVEIVEGEARVVDEGREVMFFDGTRVIGDEGIEADNFIPLGEEGFAEVRADETGSTGDERAGSGCG